MKKTMKISSILLFVLTVLYPVGGLICACFGYTFELISLPIYSLVIAILSVCVVVLALAFKDSFENKKIRFLLAVITPLSMINATLFINESPKILVAVCAFISVGCSFSLTIKYGSPFALKVPILVLSFLALLPLIFFNFIVVVFGNMHRDTIVQTVASPDGRYYAQVTDCNQGAFGGDIIVDVYEKSGIDLILFKWQKKPQRVYDESWGELVNFKDTEIRWKNDSCLMINEKEYEIRS